MSLEFIKRAFSEGRDKDDELEDAIEQVCSHPNRHVDEFFFSIIDSYQPESDTFWINQAIMYTNKAIDKNKGQRELEFILTHLSRYWFLGASLATAATQLGRFASYPNKVLAQTIGLSHPTKDEIDTMILQALRLAAYGAYIMTATDFPTGWNAKSELEIAETEPTLEKAEDIIERLKKKQHYQ